MTLSIYSHDEPLSDEEIQIALFHQPAIDSARKMIVWAGVIYPLIPLFIFAMLARFVGAKIFATPAFALAFGIGLAFFGVHLALWHWAKTSPLAATLTAFVAFLTAHVIGVVLDLGSNWVFTIAGFFILGRGVLAAYRVHKLRAGATS